jgi:hypothetical protein
MAFARFIAKASGSNFGATLVSVVTSFMAGTLQSHFRFVTAAIERGMVRGQSGRCCSATKRLCSVILEPQRYDLLFRL